MKRLHPQLRITWLAIATFHAVACPYAYEHKGQNNRQSDAYEHSHKLRPKGKKGVTHPLLSLSSNSEPT